MSRQASYEKNLIWWWHTDTAIEKSCALPLRGGAKTHREEETEPSPRLQPLCAARRAPRHTHSVLRPHKPTCAKTGTHWYTVREIGVKTAPIQPSSTLAERRRKCPLFQHTEQTHFQIFHHLANAQRRALLRAFSPLFTETNQPVRSNFNVWATSNRNISLGCLIQIEEFTRWDARREETHGWYKRRYLWD